MHSNQGRNEIDQDEGISWFQEDAETQWRYGHDVSTAEVTTASVPSDVDVSAASPTRPVDDSTIDDISLVETLMKTRSSASRLQKLKGVLFKEPSLEREEEEEVVSCKHCEWDDVQAMMDADYKLAAKLQVDDDDKENEDLKQCFEIVPDKEFVVHVIPLAVKPAPIVGFQIHRAGRQGSYEIIRANRSTKTYTLFSQLIKEFDREDLENL
ncbi:hypothetical protein Tco_0769224 [Tanacetum coccineum]|uniref:Uncharacterized protein n=1 Tax=Tanacetum coccineum TaxID=301880 RepID=A0ABQ4ZCL9_9ASTR